MKTASIEFVTFDAADVITTSGDPQLWVYGDSLATMHYARLSSTIGSFTAGTYAVYDRENGVAMSGDGWVHIGTEYALYPGQIYLTKLETSDTPGTGANVTQVNTGTVDGDAALAALCTWLNLHGTKFTF